LNCISYLLYFEVLICVLACHHRNYCVIIYLLEDEQKLSLGMLIRPKRIYNFCLFHDLLGDIVICFATLLYHFTHIWTNLLTQCTQCQFLSADVYFAGAFTQFSEAQKNSEKIYKKLAKQKLPDPRRWATGGQGPLRWPAGTSRT